MWLSYKRKLRIINKFTDQNRFFDSFCTSFWIDFSIKWISFFFLKDNLTLFCRDFCHVFSGVVYLSVVSASEINFLSQYFFSFDWLNQTTNSFLSSRNRPDKSIWDTNMCIYVNINSRQQVVFNKAGYVLSPKRRYLNLFSSKYETLTFVVRKVILVYAQSFYTNYGFPAKMLMLTHNHLRGGQFTK